MLECIDFQIRDKKKLFGKSPQSDFDKLKKEFKQIQELNIDKYNNRIKSHIEKQKASGGGYKEQNDDQLKEMKNDLDACVARFKEFNSIFKDIKNKKLDTIDDFKTIQLPLSKKLIYHFEDFFFWVCPVVEITTEVLDLVLQWYLGFVPNLILLAFPEMNVITFSYLDGIRMCYPLLLQL